ncbi:histidinol-phosphatase HisJ [Niallia sp. JL1B1071]|uniref:histidinol-phosphatase HisJ n=1 Tax=Niallia tiangongensis TaxID=3237105 RepID=UPI0037DD6967
MPKDGHIHTPFCPHGTKDSLKQYVEQALALGFTEMTFTEHAPLPKGFIDTTPTQDSSITFETLPIYLKEIQSLKKEYEEIIKINVGLEIDYIEGFELEIRNFLADWGHLLDDSILSVHFLKNPMNNHYDCVDYSPELFGQIVKQYGGISNVYNSYYQTLLKSIQADLGPAKPKRIGHMTLIHKFQDLYPVDQDFQTIIFTILNEVKNKGYELDYNGAGVNKPFCKEPYPSKWIVEEAIKRNIPLVYGSDAHQAKDLGQGRNVMLWNNR